jgi:hypothetical protein
VIKSKIANLKSKIYRWCLVAVKRKKRWKIALIVVAMLSFWTFIVCYPNPFIFIRNSVRYLRFPIDPSVTEVIEVEVPDEPAEIEKFVMALVEYQYDWENYGVPDYVSTARQAVARRRGDCEDRAAVLASLLEAKDISYDLKASLTHYWVDYPGKRPSRLENENVSYFGKVDGKYKLKLPDLSQWRRYLNAGKKGGWDVMPASRKVVMISGWVLIIFSGYLLGRRRKAVISNQ